VVLAGSVDHGFIYMNSSDSGWRLSIGLSTVIIRTSQMSILRDSCLE